jgi:UDP-N-acetylglucosamine--N-acetylmuramyl-(pentapeptide) pyrophosphoryl-undecaprenol N-acetylglucosamine transferase
MADHVTLTVEDTQEFIPSRVERTVTGYPTRQDLSTWTRDAARRYLNLSAGNPVFLVMGGSRGATSINHALFAALHQLLNHMQVVHVSGQGSWQEVEQIQGTLPVDLHENSHPYPYLHAEMGAALAAADLVCSRAGASSLGEYPLFGLPAVLVPYPYAWRYQKVNADYLVRSGAALQLLDADLMENLGQTVLSLMEDEPRRKRMQKAMSGLAKPHAARSIARILMSMSERAS